ncbi:MAG: alpha/beta hydrolase [Proteobacteria bacterium]|nr:alpha/beta hydrolase [Pseudomonadota bacterium]
MPVLQLNDHEGLYYEWDQPCRVDAPTFVFVNAITGDAGMWQTEIGPALRDRGFGTLCYNFRGQANSPFEEGRDLTENIIIQDLRLIVEQLEIKQPILIGLSIGGLYAAKAVLAGLKVAGLVLINTLRKIGPRLDWINAGTLRLMQVAGPNLMRDVMTPLLFGPDYLEAHRHEFLADDTVYEPLAAKSGAMNLITWMGKTEWAIDYSQLKCPVLVMVGPNDRVFFDAAIVDELYASLPNARRVDVPEAGHMLPVEAPAAFIEAVTSFVGDYL